MCPLVPAYAEWNGPVPLCTHCKKRALTNLSASCWSEIIIGCIFGQGSNKFSQSGFAIHKVHWQLIIIGLVPAFEQTFGALCHELSIELHVANTAWASSFEVYPGSLLSLAVSQWLLGRISSGVGKKAGWNSTWPGPGNQFWSSGRYCAWTMDGAGISRSPGSVLASVIILTLHHSDGKGVSLAHWSSCLAGCLAPAILRLHWQLSCEFSGRLGKRRVQWLIGKLLGA
jgi:hypothetical protein